MDEADLLTPAQERVLTEKSAAIERDVGPQFVIVTVPTPVDDANRPDLTPVRRASATAICELGMGALAHPPSASTSVDASARASTAVGVRMKEGVYMAIPLGGCSGIPSGRGRRHMPRSLEALRAAVCVPPHAAQCELAHRQAAARWLRLGRDTRLRFQPSRQGA